MRILIIGGTQFIGKHFALTAIERGHEVTLFNRGSKPAPSGVLEEIVGDRNTDLARLRGRQWDVVVDTSAYVPRQVSEAATALRHSVERYLFVSTISVYADDEGAGLNEESELIRLDDPATEEVSSATYGGLKVLCEEALAELYPSENRLIVRPGIVVGPDDPTDRFTYWLARMARGGEVLAPAGPDRPLQWIDVRDLAAFMVLELERDIGAVYNVVSESGRFTMGALLASAERISGSDASVTWASEEFLLDNGVKPATDLPFWLPGKRANFFKIDGSRAYLQGFRPRSLEDSARDTLAWQVERGDPPLKVGLSPEREAQLLADWRDS